MVFSETRLITVTVRVWFLRQARAAWLELCRVPGQVAVDDDAGALKVQSGAAAVGAEEDTAAGVGLEGVDFGPAPSLRDAAGVPGEPDVQPPAAPADELEHAFPLGEDDDLGPVPAAFLEDLIQFTELRADAVVRVEDVIGVADHPHHGQFAHELVEFLPGEGPAPGGLEQPCGRD